MAAIRLLSGRHQIQGDWLSGAPQDTCQVAICLMSDAPRHGEHRGVNWLSVDNQIDSSMIPRFRTHVSPLLFGAAYEHSCCYQADTMH